MRLDLQGFPHVPHGLAAGPDGVRAFWGGNLFKEPE